MEYLEAKLDGTIGTILIDHLEKRNALSHQLVDALVSMSPRRFERIQVLRRIVYDSEDYAEGIKAFRRSASLGFRGVNSTGVARFLDVTAGSRSPILIEAQPNLETLFRRKIERLEETLNSEPDLRTKAGSSGLTSRCLLRAINRHAAVAEPIPKTNPTRTISPW